MSKVVHIFPESFTWEVVTWEKLQPEEKILQVLAKSKEPRTHYQLWKKDNVASSNKTVLKALGNLERIHMIEFKREKEGRKRKLYNLTFTGLIACLKYQQAWKSIDIIAESKKDMLPLIFGKWSFFKKERILDDIVLNLQLVSSILWKHTVSLLHFPETLYGLLMIRAIRKPRKLMVSKTLHTQKTDVDVNRLVFGITNLPWWPIDTPPNGVKRLWYVQKQKRLLQVLRGDPDIEKYIDAELQRNEQAFELHKKNITSWREWFQSTCTAAHAKNNE